MSKIMSAYTFTMKYDMFYSVSNGKKFEQLEEKNVLATIIIGGY